MLTIENLSFRFSDHLPLLEDLSLTLKKEQIISILGPSGSGKTTLFGLITGRNKPQTGKILLNDQEKKGFFTYMTQEELLLPWKTALENLLLPFQLSLSWPCYYFSRKELKKKAQELLEEVGLARFSHYYPSELSGGMKQRLSFARALLFKKPVLLLDEPFGSIDSETREVLYALLLRYKKQHQLAILLITHQMEEAKKLSDEIYVLEKRGLKKL